MQKRAYYYYSFQGFWRSARASRCQDEYDDRLSVEEGGRARLRMVGAPPPPYATYEGTEQKKKLKDARQ
jgi:hypothetical protein